MSKLKQLDSFTVSAHWLPAIINDDTTGLSDEEEQLMECFLLGKHAIVWRCNDETFWTKDEITGLFGMCVELEAWG